jgi:hypothetical protein
MLFQTVFLRDNETLRDTFFARFDPWSGVHMAFTDEPHIVHAFRTTLASSAKATTA